MRVTAARPSLDLPPPYELVTLREKEDAFDRACALAAEKGAGTLTWVRRFDVAEFAVVLEPEEELRVARRAFYVGMNAMADALAGHAPPERPITFDWPDAIRVDGVLVGGGRLGWPQSPAEDERPDWLVFGGMVRTIVVKADEPGMRPLLGALDEVGFEAIEAGEIIESFARHLMAGLHEWREDGPEAAIRAWRRRLAAPSGNAATNGASVVGVPGHERLRDALAAPTWRDPETGMPWL
jgi:hypothetical protein